MSKQKTGFSLIELIVVITIIGVITAVAALSFGGATKKSRDSRRIADLEKYRVALEMARQVGMTYPLTLDVLTAAPYNLLSNTLADPKSGYIYKYYRYNLDGSNNNYAYGLYACVEDLGSTNGSWSINNCNGHACGCNPSGCITGGCNYRVLNP